MTHPALGRLKRLNAAVNEVGLSESEEEPLTAEALKEAISHFSTLLFQLGISAGYFNDSDLAKTLDLDDKWRDFFTDLSAAQRSVFYLLEASVGERAPQEPDDGSRPWIGPH